MYVRSEYRTIAPHMEDFGVAGAALVDVGLYA
jgi:hypothetical protein